MPECQAYGCTNRHGAGKSKGKRFFVIPDGKTDPEKRELSQKWLHQIGTGHTVDNFTFHKYKVVCEDHFEEKCFEEDVKARLMGTKPRKNLKPAPFQPFSSIVARKKATVDTAPSEKISETGEKSLLFGIISCEGCIIIEQGWDHATVSEDNEINQLLTAKDQPPSKKLCQPLHCSPKGVSSLLDPPAEVLSPAVTPTTAVTRITQQFIPDALSSVCASTQTYTDVTEMGCQAGVPQVKTHHACTVELDHPYSFLSADVSSEGMAPPQETPRSKRHCHHRGP
ncbi:hypothetical protein BSL78_28729 [Apostichopus japonicus]|uniref:THAP-type domain-containing protein n=1 Tax=Stichopus japonicus TaxID=307972 RepID=A0A2G8JFD5_STIJA|nr:hypothetical protein BSL78_28729 [Apostichopus japonicus]